MFLFNRFDESARLLPGKRSEEAVLFTPAFFQKKSSAFSSEGDFPEGTSATAFRLARNHQFHAFYVLVERPLNQKYGTIRQARRRLPGHFGEPLL